MQYLLGALGALILSSTLILSTPTDAQSVPNFGSTPHINEKLSPSDPTTKRIYERLNEFRSRLNLPQLHYDPIVAAIAQEHSADMAASRHLSHDGFPQRFLTLTKTDTTKTAGENVAFNFGFNAPADEAIRGWLLSEHHLKNIIGKFDATGIGIARASNGEIYFTQLFVTYQPKSVSQP